MIDEDVERLEKRLKQHLNNPEYNRLMGFWYQQNNQSEKAISYFKPYVGKFHRYRLMLADCYLCIGDLDNAWTYYKTRPRNAEEGRPHSTGNRWNGEPLNGKKLLIVSEQGYGDSIFHYRFLKLLQKTYPNCHITYVCHPELRELYWYQKDVFRVIHFGCPELYEQFDYYAYDDDLMFRFKETFDGEPWEPYLKAPTANLELDTGKVNIGVVWESRFGNKNIPIFDIDRIMDVKGIDVYSLQKDVSYCPFKNLANKLTDFMETAKIINQLDLIVSTCTAASHLAGALGKPVILLGPYKIFWPYKCMRAKGKGTGHQFWYPLMECIPMEGKTYYKSVTKLIKDLKDIVRIRQGKPPMYLRRGSVLLKKD